MATDQPGMANGVYHGIGQALRKAFPDARSVLEIGCGEGKLLRVLDSLFEHVTGLEKDYDAYLEAEKVTDADLTHCTVGNIPMQLVPRDLIVSWQVLEHLPDEMAVRVTLETLRWGTTNVHSICLTPPESARRDDPSHTLLRSRTWWLTEFTKAGFVYDDEGDKRLRKAGKFSDGPELFVFTRASNTPAE